jgi:hypothetical protein
MEQRHSASSRMPSTGTSPRHMGQIFKCVVSDASFSRSMPRQVTGHAVRPGSTASRDAGGSPWLHEDLARIGYFYNTRLVLRPCFGRVTPLLQDRLRVAGPQPPPSTPRGLESADAVPRLPALASGLQLGAFRRRARHRSIPMRTGARHLMRPRGHLSALASRSDTRVVDRGRLEGMLNARMVGVFVWLFDFHRSFTRP